MMKALKRNVVKRVTFKLDAPEAKDVRLAGDFNAWDPSKALLKKAKSGAWKMDMELSPGKYEYKYVVDGQWRRDPLNNLFVINSFGSENSIVEL